MCLRSGLLCCNPVATLPAAAWLLTWLLSVYCIPPACQAVAMVGIPDERLGELGCAVVVCHAGKTLGFEEMKLFLTGRGVARFKLPEYLVLRDALPTTPSGKVQKFKLREELKTLNEAKTHV